MDNNNLKKLVRSLKKDGLVTTVNTVNNYIRRTFIDSIEGTIGYYSVRSYLLKRHYDSENINPIWISPDDINYLTGEYEYREQGHLDYVPHFKPQEANWQSLPYKQEVQYGTTVGGNWDKHREKFSQLLMFQGIRQRYIDKKPWDETNYYEELVSRFRDQGWSTEDADQLAMKRCRDIESIYQKITAEGYQSQRQLNGHPLHEITVTIARDGTLLYNCEGRHRLSIAKILEVQEIPVLVLAKHKQYDQNTDD